MIRDRGFMTPAELADRDETSRLRAEARRRDAAWAKLVRDNARIGIYFHPDEDPNVNPWSASHFSPCPPWCTKHGGESA